MRSLFIVSKLLTIKKMISSLLPSAVFSYLRVSGDNEAQATFSANQRTTMISGCLSLAKSSNALAQFDMSTRYFTGTEGVKRDEVLA